jgi:hypothetical protein
MIPSRLAVLFKPMLSRTFTSHTVDGFTGAVGNTPLVRLRSFRTSRGTPHLSKVDSDPPEKPFGKGGLEDIWQSRIPEPWWEREGPSRARRHRGSGGRRPVRALFSFPPAQSSHCFHNSIDPAIGNNRPPKKLHFG